MEKIPDLLVLYDGECGFCNRSVAFILKWERSNEVHFAAIQSEFTQTLFKEKNWPVPDLNTFYFIRNGEKFERSTAAMNLMAYLRSPVSWLRVFRILPTRFRDWCYNFVANRRTRISKGFCVLPNEEQSKRFIR